MSRPLTLHVSALNDAEYARYTASIHDILDSEPHDYDKAAVGVREARAWLRGRYPALASYTLDSILRLFAPELGAADVLTGGQFFAVLRLVSHVLGGKEMDPSLVFVQAHFEEHKSRPSSPVNKSCQVPSPSPNPFTANGSAKPFSVPLASAVMPTPARPPPPTLPPKPTNPFLKRRGSQDLPPQPAPAGVGAFGARPAVIPDAKIPPLPPRKPHVLPPPRHASMNVQYQPPANRELPPPLPRNVSAAHTTNTLIQQSLQATRIAQSLKHAEQKLEQERVMEVLRSSSDSSAGSIRRVRSTSPTKNPSSSASSAGSSSAERTAMHNRVPKLPPRRNLSPPASTAPSARSFEQVATAAVTPFKRSAIPSPVTNCPPVPPEPPQRRRASSPTRTPPRPLSELVPDPPPTHPDRKPSAPPGTDPDPTPTNASPRVGRSRSLHHPTPPPAPPPRRKRPESVQVTPTSPSPFDSPFANPPSPLPSTPPPPPLPGANMRLSRHLSLSSSKRDFDRDRDRDRERGDRERERERERERTWEAFSDSPLGTTLHRTFTSLSARAQPALDTARYKAEGAFARRGFVQHAGAGGGAGGSAWGRGAEGEARLMGDVDGSPGVDVDDGRALDQDVTGGSGGSGGSAEGVEERARRWRRGGVDVAVVEREGVDGRGGRRMVLERDDLKWPAGEGWRPL